MSKKTPTTFQLDARLAEMMREDLNAIGGGTKTDYLSLGATVIHGLLNGEYELVRPDEAATQVRLVMRTAENMVEVHPDSLLE